jgi:hypothetical protein
LGGTAVLLELATDSRFGDTRWEDLKRVGSLGRDQPGSSLGETPKGQVVRHSEAAIESSGEEGA